MTIWFVWVMKLLFPNVIITTIGLNDHIDYTIMLNLANFKWEVNKRTTIRYVHLTTSVDYAYVFVKC